MLLRLLLQTNKIDLQINNVKWNIYSTKQVGIFDILDIKKNI